MIDDLDTIVLVGGGLASAKAAEGVRDAGFTGRVVLITDEPERPYERPPLSKGVLIGSEAPDSVYVHDEGFYAEHDIDLILGDPVTVIDRRLGAVRTESGRVVPYSRLLLATGAEPRRLPLAGQDLDGLVTLRTLADTLHLADRLRAASHVTIVGAGWIGCEVAAAARKAGAEVTLIDPLSVPLQRVLGHEAGAVFADLHRDHGVKLRMGVGVTGARGSGAGATGSGERERVEQLTLSDGTTVDTDLVVVGIGVTPRVDLARDAGLETHDGIVVDQTLATGDPRIFAAGDVANAWHPHYGHFLRVEHWANALNQGKTVAGNLLGAGEAYDRLPYFYSDQYDLGMEYVGHAVDWDEVVFRGDPGTREFIAFWLTGGRVTAAMNVNVWDVVEDLKALIQDKVEVVPDRLRDVEVPLSEIGGSRP